MRCHDQGCSICIETRYVSPPSSAASQVTLELILCCDCPYCAHHMQAACMCSIPAASAVIEKYTRNTRFCLICNYVGKIIPALQSRCTRFRFPPLAESYVRSRLQHVIECERWVSTALASLILLRLSWNLHGSGQYHSHHSRRSLIVRFWQALACPQHLSVGLSQSVYAE